MGRTQQYAPTGLRQENYKSEAHQGTMSRCCLSEFCVALWPSLHWLLAQLSILGQELGLPQP